ncbi:GHKL domain-containing protein, partial [candidate division GN15 bacterium]|nr:GHKL domain-containing protein [candidate division GN15 bacterium]
LLHIQNDWRDNGTMSSLVFNRAGLASSYTINQINRRTSRFDSYWVADYDNDGGVEVALGYRIQDSLWCEIVDPFADALATRLIGVPTSNDDSPGWDGLVYVMPVVDVNDDGFAEVLVNINAGYDLTPRELMLWDWHRDTILWRMDIPGFLGEQKPMKLLRHPGERLPLVVFGASAHCNGVEANGMDDCHTYVLAVDLRGHVAWKYATADAYAHCHPRLIDLNADGQQEIVGQVHRTRPDDSIYSVLTAFDYTGRIVDSIVFDEAAFWLMNHESEDGAEFLTLQLGPQNVAVINSDFDVTHLLEFHTNVRPLDCADYLGIGSRQLVCDVGDGSMLLLSGEFEPLALINNAGTLVRMRGEVVGASLLVHSGDGSRYYAFSQAPTVIRIEYFLGTVIVLTLAYLTWNIRQKRVISRQKAQLERAHEDLKAAQARLVAAEKYRQAKDIAGGFAHEIRNALFPARGSLSKLGTLLKGRGEDLSSDLLRHIGSIKEAISRAVDLTRVISTYTSLDAPIRPQAVPVADAVESVRQDIQRSLDEHDIRLQVSGSADASVLIEPKQLQLAMKNLLTNSVDALTESTNKAIFLHWEHSGDRVTISVRDMGTGIAPEHLSRVTDAFFSTKPDRGSGLGLAIVKRVVESSGGALDISSEAGEGTTVRLTVPATR